MDYQNYLYLEYRRAIRKFQKLQTRFEKRIANNTFQELTARRRHKLLAQLRKLKQKIEQLTGRLKLATAGGSLALSLGLMTGAQTEGFASNGPTGIGVPKTLATDKTLLNTEKDGSQENPDAAMNDDGEYVFVWESADNQIKGKGFAADGEGLEFTVTDDTFRNNKPTVALSDDGEFVVAWRTYELTSPYSTYSIKYMRYEVDEGAIVGDGPYTIAQGSSTESKILENPDIAIDDEGNFAIVWEDTSNPVSDIKARYVNAENVSDLELNVTGNTSFESAEKPAVDIDDEDNFIVVWQESFDNGSASSSAVKSRRYKQNVALEGEVDVKSHMSVVSRLKTPDVALSSDGSFGITWHDEYNNFSQEYIYAKKFNSEGNELCEITVENQSFADISNPAIAADKDGAFAVIYDLEKSGGYNEILGARYNQLGGHHEDLTFQDTGGEEEAANPTIAMNSRGDFVVAWDDAEFELNSPCEENQDCEGTGVYFKQYKDAPNEPYCLVEEYMVNDFSMGTQYRPSVDVDQNGNYVVVWQGEWHSTVEDGSGIIGQRYNADGTKAGIEFQVNTTTTSQQVQPHVATDPVGNFTVVWSSYDSPNQAYDIMGQRFFADGTKNGSEFEIDQKVDVSQEQLLNPSIDINSDGDAIVVWQANNSGNGMYGLYGRRIESDGIMAGNEFKMDSRTASGSRNNPDVAIDNDGGFVVAWGARVSGDEKTYIRRFDSKDGALDQDDVQISSGSNAQKRTQSIDMDKVSGDFLVAFSKEAGSYSSILASKYKSDGTAIFEEESLTNSARADDEPHVAGNDNGEFVIVWNNSSGDNHMAISMFNDENELAYEKHVAIDPDNSMVGVAVALDNDGDAVVTTGAYYSGGYNVYAKVLGKPLEGNILAGNEFIVNSKITKNQTQPDVAQNADGDFVIVWRDHYAATTVEYNIKAQRYNDEGIRQGSEMLINNQTNENAGDPAVALKDDGTFIVVWKAYSAVGGEDDDVLGSVFDWDGNEIKDDFIINEETSHHQRNPDVAINHEGDFQVIWTERRSITTPWNKLYAREVSSDGVPDALGEQFLYDVGESGNVSLQASVAVNNDGDMAIPYIYDYDGVENGFFVFDAGAQVLVDDVDFSASEQVESRQPSITTNQDGDFVVSWSEYDLGNNAYDQMVRKYSSGSDFDVAAVKVNDFTKHSAPSIVAVDDGDYIISSADRDDSDDFYNIYVQRLSSNLETIGPAILANKIDGSDVNENAIAASPDGSYTVVWQSSYADGSDEAIVARQFVSHKPVIDSQGLTLDEGSEENITSGELSFSNPSDNNNSALLKVNQLPSQGTLKLNGNNVALFQELDEDDMFFLSYEHDGSETTSDLFTFSVGNEDFETNIYTFDISVNPINDEPDLTSNNGLELDEGDSQSLFETFAVNDPDNSLDEVTYTIVTVPAHGALSRSESTVALKVGDTFTQEEVGFADIYYNHDGSENHTDSFEFTLSDLASTSATQQVAITINPVNDAPTVANAIADAIGTVGSSFSLTLAGNTFDDVDGGALTLTATLADDSALPSWLSFATDTFSGTPDTETTYTIKVTADDGEATVSDEFELTIEAAPPLNAAPVVANPIPDQTAAGSEAFSYTVPANTFEDVETPALTLSASLSDGSDLPDWLSFDVATGVFSGTTPLDPNFDTILAIQVTASDGEASVSDEFTLTVASVLNVDNQDLSQIRVYPNPVENILHLRPEADMMGDIQVYLFNESGKVMTSSLIYKTSIAQSFEIDVQNLERGLYFVRMINENTTTTFKISKE